jgi:hypothetical protein
MSLLLNVIFASHARSTHHKLALDALRHLQGNEAGQWTDLIISEHAAYLEGAKAPDDDFKDFKNHVLHVKENFWGGAVSSAEHWYGQFIDHLRSAEWKDAAYAAGVLSHYYSDPQMPFHTGQTEAEGAVHRAAELSVTKSYEKLRTLLEQELGGYPRVHMSAAENWLEEMVKSGAVMANQYYDLLIDHYNLAAGVKDPPAGLDRVAQEAVARCLGHATIGFARILERAFEESSVRAPEVTLTMKAIMATINVPIRTVVNRLADAKDRKIVEAIYQEVQETGKAIHSLPESEKLVRQFHAAEVRKISMMVLNAESARPAGQKFGKPLQDQNTVPPKVAQAPIVKPSVAMESAPMAAAMPVPAVTPATQSEPTQSEPTQLELTQLELTQLELTQLELTTPESVSSVVSQIAKSPEVAIATAQPAMVQPAVAQAAAVKWAVAVPDRSAAMRCYLKSEAPIVDAPSIGPKTATRFNAIGMTTVEESLNADPEITASKLAVRHITPDVIREWQAQSRLMVEVPGLCGHDAQLLVAAGVETSDQLSDSNAAGLLDAVKAVTTTTLGKSILRDGSAPDLDEVKSWIAAAQFSPLESSHPVAGELMT